MKTIYGVSGTLWKNPIPPFSAFQPSLASPLPPLRWALAPVCLPPSRPAACPAKWGMKLAFYSCRVQRGRGIKRKSRMKGKKKKKKKRIRRLGLAEMCNVKHHRCQLGNLGPGLTPIHKSRRLGRRAGPMWIENGVASGPSDAGGGWPGWATARKALQLGWAGAAPGARACPGWAESVKERSEGWGRL